MAAPSDIVGIDLGTTNTSVAAPAGGKVTVLSPGDGARAFPSVVSYPHGGEPVAVDTQVVVNFTLSGG